MIELPTDIANAGPWLVAISACGVAAATDLRARRIPNLLTLPLAAAGFLYAGLTGGAAGLGGSLGAYALLMLPFVLMFMFAGGGAGDAKLMGGVGAWLGLGPALPVLACVLIAGGVVGVGYAAYRRQGLEVARNVRNVAMATAVSAAAGSPELLRAEAGHVRNQGLKMPYGVAILVGVVAAAVWVGGLR